MLHNLADNAGSFSVEQDQMCKQAMDHPSQCPASIQSVRVCGTDMMAVRMIPREQMVFT